ncbi:MAG: PspA/IM30 family protein [Oscillospiraceae bacterium]|jgi:phage shock protein A|nr:PspA/IM30 family protein [Oscillospiraceae bacterium]
MGILSRANDILKSNINALLDKAEDPEKLVNQYLLNARSDLAKVKSETAGVIAEETRAKKVLDANNDNIARYEALAAKALLAGEEADALRFLAEQTKYEQGGKALLDTYNLAAANAAKMRELYNKLVADIGTLESKRAEIAAKASVARAQDRINQVGANAGHYASVLSKFEELERKADHKLDRAMAEAELNQLPQNEIAALEQKYSIADQSAEEKLAALKAKLQLG